MTISWTNLFRLLASAFPMPTFICENALLIFSSSPASTNKLSEDFGLQNARRILDKYQSKIPCFNDDIQGTGCVTLAAMLAGLHVSDVKIDDVRVVVFGSGTAGTGIADQIADTIVTQTHKSKEEASKQIWYVTFLKWHLGQLAHHYEGGSNFRSFLSSSWCQYFWTLQNGLWPNLRRCRLASNDF